MTPASGSRAETLAFEREVMEEQAPYARHWVVTGSVVYRRERAEFADFVLAVLRDSGSDPSRPRFLDVGCGTGEILELFADRGCRRLTGLDLSPAMLTEARRHLPEAALAIGLAEDPPFRPGSFDVLTAVFTIHHLFDPAALFAAAHTLLRPGGWLFVLDFNRDGWWRSPQWRRLAFRFGAAPLRFFLRWKNRRAIAEQPSLRSRFNPSHRLHTLDDLDGWAHAHGFSTQLSTRGLYRLWFVTDLFEHSSVDRAFLDRLQRVEDALCPTAAGGLVWLACRRDGADGSSARA